MKTINHRVLRTIALASLALLSLSGCLTSAKMDKYVSQQYNDQLPKAKEIKKANIVINSAIPSSPDVISNTVQKTSKLLPLIVYWSFDYRHTCTLNPAIGVANFSAAVNSLTNKNLVQKIGNGRLELTVEQTPNTFALVDKAHFVWLIYVFSWDRIYMEPDFKDLVVSYKLTGADSASKSGKITVKSIAENKGKRYLQSWKSATAEYLADYNASFTTMTKSFMSKLMEEL